MGAPEKATKDAAALETQSPEEDFDQPSPLRKIISVASIAAGVQFGWALQLSLLTPYVQLLGIPHKWSSLIWLCGPISGMIVQPIVGFHSDRCTSRFGRRRPFIASGAILVAVAVFLIGYAADLGYKMGKLICTGSDDASLIVWNPKTCESIHVVKGHPYHTEGLTCLDINSNSSLAITGSKDGSVHIVNIVTGKVVSSLTSHTDSVECAKFSPSSATIPLAATGAMDNKLIIWDLQHSTPRFTCDHADGVTCLTWIGTSKYIATGCADGTVSVWDSLLGNCVHTFHGHQDAVQAISVSANTDFIVSVSVDNTARVYETSEFLNKVT